MEKRIIKTKLQGKNELFRTLALGEATGYPVLLVGVPGVAKTQILLDYAGSKFAYDKNKVKDLSFIIELDENTKGSEIKGHPDMKELIENKTFKIDSKIASSKFIMINEVDKGSSGVRNTLLSVMREKCLFLGSEIKRCDWDVFVGSCNSISKDEIDAPFFDRFVLTQTVDRVGKNNAMLLFSVAGNKHNEFELSIPSKEDLANEVINEHTLSVLANELYDNISDRTMTYIPNILKAIKLIWNVEDEDAALICVKYVCPEKASIIASLLMDQDKEEILSKIEKLSSTTDIMLFKNVHEEIKNMINSYTKKKGNKNKGKSLLDKLDEASQEFMNQSKFLIQDQQTTI